MTPPPNSSRRACLIASFIGGPADFAILTLLRLSYIASMFVVDGTQFKIDHPETRSITITSFFWRCFIFANEWEFKEKIGDRKIKEVFNFCFALRWEKNRVRLNPTGLHPKI